FMGEKSKIIDLYGFLNIDISWYSPPKIPSVKYIAQAIKGQPTILVHNTFTQDQDFNYVNGNHVFWCFCPNANLYIEGCLPDYSLFKNAQICVGTDSLASNAQLDMLNEVNVILERSKTFTFEELLQA